MIIDGEILYNWLVLAAASAGIGAIIGGISVLLIMILRWRWLPQACNWLVIGAYSLWIILTGVKWTPTSTMTALGEIMAVVIVLAALSTGVVIAFFLIYRAAKWERESRIPTRT